jgi:hypothetical protein
MTTRIDNPYITLIIYSHSTWSLKFSWSIRRPSTAGFPEAHEKLSIAIEFLYPVIAGIRHPDIELAMINLWTRLRESLFDTRYFQCLRWSIFIICLIVFRQNKPLSPESGKN